MANFIFILCLCVRKMGMRSKNLSYYNIFHGFNCIIFISVFFVHINQRNKIIKSITWITKPKLITSNCSILFCLHRKKVLMLLLLLFFFSLSLTQIEMSSILFIILIGFSLCCNTQINRSLFVK